MCIIRFIRHSGLVSLLLLLCAILVPVSAADHKIVVIGDPHVMAEELLVKDGKVFQKYLSGGTKNPDFSKAIFEAAVSNILDMKPKPELVLIVGDITKDGELPSHNYVKSKLDELKAAGVATLVIPGNHDWGKRASAVYYDGDTKYSATTCVRFGFSDNSLEQIYADYGFVRCWKDSASTSVPVERESEESTLTYACEPIPGIVIIGIDSGNDGVLSENTLDWVCDKAYTASSKGKLVLPMMHHPLISHNTAGSHILYPNMEDAGIGYEMVRNRLADSGVKAVLTGHIHTHDIAQDWNADFSRTIYDITTGMLSHYPCYYRVLTFNEERNELIITSKRTSGIGKSLLGDSFNLEDLKARFIKAGEGLKSKLVSEGLNKDTAFLVTPYLASLYIYSREGDEHKNADAQKLLDVFPPLLINLPYYYDFVNSALQNKSHYGTDREAQTDDCSLIINLNNGITSIDSRYVSASPEVWYTMDGRAVLGTPKRKGVYICSGRKIVIR